MTPTGIETTPAFTIIWWLVAATSVGGALLVILLPDLLKAALSLVVSFLAVAALFVMLNAEFLAVVQLLIYAGAIPILIIFAVLVMRDVQRGNPFNRLRVPAGFLATLVLALILFVTFDTKWDLLEDAALSPGEQQQAAEVYGNSVPAIADLLLNNYALALEVAAVLLLAAMVGAMALVRER